MAALPRVNVFPKVVRIIRSADFSDVVRARGKDVIRARGSWFEIKAVSNLSSEKSLIGLTVGKRYAKRAVDRNLVKRILREEIRRSALIHSGSEASPFAARMIVIRLKAVIPDSAVRSPNRDGLKCELREDAKKLICLLERKLAASIEKSAADD